MPYYTMTNLDYERWTPEQYEEQFDNSEDYDVAEDAAIGELLVDDDDTTFETYIVDETGVVHCRIWMSDGNVWVHPTEDEEPHSPVSYDDLTTFGFRQGKPNA